MKKRLIILGLICGALTVSCATAVPFKENINKNERYYIEGVSTQNGLYIKVTDPSTIQSGEELLMVGNDRSAFTYFVGASYHYWVSTEESKLTHYNDNFYYLQDKQVELITFERDTTSNGNTFYLKLKHYVDNSDYGKIRSGYLVHEAYNNNGVTAWGDLFIRGSVNTSKPDPFRWDMTYVDGHMRIVSKTDRLLFHKTGNDYIWDSFIASTHLEWDSNINLYRKATILNTSVIANTQNVKTDYLYGEEVDFTGLSVEVTCNYGQTDSITFTSSYQSHPELFELMYLSNYEKFVHFKWCGYETGYYVNIALDTSKQRLFLKPSTQIKDLRGTYLLGSSFQSGEGAAYLTVVLKTSTLSSTPGTPGYDLIDFADINPISDLITTHGLPDHYGEEDTKVTNNLVTIDYGHLAGDYDYYGYYIKIGDQALYFNRSGDQNERGQLYLDYPALNGGTQIDVDAYNRVLIGDYNYLVFDTSSLTFKAVPDIDSGLIPVCLYKLQMTDNIKSSDQELNAFRTKFFSLTNNYDPAGITHYVSADNWQELAGDFADLSLDAQSYLASLTYTHNQVAPQSFEALVDRYDSILNTYFEISGFSASIDDGDFMWRTEAGTYQRSRGVTFDGRNCGMTSTGSSPQYQSSFVANIVPEANYTYPDYVVITMGNKTLVEGENGQYTYTPSTGVININQKVIVDDIVISADAVFAQKVVTYIGQDADGNEVSYEVYANGNYTVLTYAQAGFGTVVPKGKVFKCWSVNGVEVNPEETINVTDNTIIRAVYVRTNPDAQAIEDGVATVPYLSYSYDGTGDNLTISDVIIRFRAVITKSLWDALDGENHNITGYGVLLSTEEFLAGVDLKNMVGEFEGPDGSTVSGIDGVNIKDYRSTGAPTLYSEEEFGGYGESCYIWNLRKMVGTSAKQLTRSYVALAYVITESDGMVFLAQTSASVKSLAQRMLNGHSYDETPAYESLSYLANLQ